MAHLRVVSINDVYLLDNLPRLKSLVDRHVRAGGADAYVVVLAGDFVAPSLLSSIDSGRGMVDCLNAVGVTHVVLGNHEDDIPPEELRQRLSELTATCLGTNVRGSLGLPTHVIVDVAGRKVGLVGVVMDDPSFYRGKPFGGVELLPANAAALAETALLFRAGVASVIPITHQSIGDDRALAAAQTAPPFPLVVGGHEHIRTLERVGETWIVKADSEAASAVISDIVWPDGDGLPKVSTRVESVAEYPEDAEVRARVDKHMSAVRELGAATLYWVSPGTTLSSRGSRSRQTTMGTLICSRIRDCLGAEAALFNGGGIRGERDYPVRFTYGDVEAEVPFDNEVVVVGLPGRVIAAAIAASRHAAPLESGAFLQVDDNIVVDASNAVVAIAGARFDPERHYQVALIRELLLGLDGVEPLVSWAKENERLVPPDGAGRQPKFVLVQSFAIGIWRDLGGFDAIDADGDDRVTQAEIAAAVARRHPSQVPSAVLADLVLRAVDADADRIVSRADAEIRDSVQRLPIDGVPDRRGE
jgi:2',3'-cyclic-nucleotide 2'-phosphodiesterase (5'-nucleotidase family)